jgi:hypothetical protein
VPRTLSDTAVKNAKPKARPYKIADSGGLFLLVMPNGSKYWRLRYFSDGKEKTLALGVYPDVPLADARERRAEAKKHLAAGIDPGKAKKQAKREEAFRAANTFEAIAVSGTASESTNGHQRPQRWSLIASTGTPFQSWANAQSPK